MYLLPSDICPLRPLLSAIALCHTCFRVTNRYLNLVPTVTLRRFLAVFLTGLAWLPAVPVPASSGSAIWLHRAWQSDEGLPDNSVVGVAQTPDGYLWVATAGGLMRFDGARL